MIVSFTLLAAFLQFSLAALQEEPPELEDLLLVNGLEYDFSLEKSQEDCMAPLGLERKMEFEDSFSASSYSRTDRRPVDARLNSLTGWQPKTSDPDQSQWLALDLMKSYKITGIAIQAGNWQDDSSSGTFGNWVTRYRVQYSDSNGPNDYVDYTLDGAVQHFDGNHHQYNTVKQDFRIPIVSRYIRIVPEAWNREIGLRVELYGCDYPLDMISFSGKEVLRMNTNNKDTRDSVYFDPYRGFISLRFRSSRPNGLLVHGVGSTGDYIGVELNQGELNVHINLGSSSRIDGKTTVTVGHSLYDSQWHWLNVSRIGRDMTISLDGYETYAQIKGSFENLNIDTRLTFGGTDRFSLPGISVSQMFKGCVENLNVNGYLVISEVQRKQNSAFAIKGFFYSLCREDTDIPVTFEDYSSMLYIEGARFSRRTEYLEDLGKTREALKPFLVIEFAFRTWEETGLILYNGYDEGYLQIGLYSGLLQVLIYMANDATPYRPARIGYNGLNDGAWHHTRLEFSENFIVAIIDEETYAVNRLFKEFTPSSDYHFGGYYERGTGAQAPDMQGFIGCLKALEVNGVQVSLQRLLLGDTSLQTGGRVTSVGNPMIDQCPIVDRCTPNPCFHGGICFQSWFDFVCDCSLTNYNNDRLCYSSTFLPSCEAYEFLNETASGNRYIDVDGAGPIPPYLVDCDIGETATAQSSGNVARQALQYLHKLSFFYNSAQSTYSVVTIIKGDGRNKKLVRLPAVNEPGGYTISFGYGGTDINSLGYLADMSNTCMQFIYAKCYNGAKLLDSPASTRPHSWWVSRQGYKMINWGNATAHSGKCGCSMTPGKQCARNEYYCNCDAPVSSNGNGDNSYMMEDSGFLMEKEYLPVRQIRAGGTTGSSTQDKTIGFIVGDMYCAGDKRMQNEASFWDKRSAMFFPAIDATYAIDVSFYFKTRSVEGVFISMTGSDPGRRYNYPRLRDRDGNNFYLPSSDTDHFKISLVKTNATADSIIELSYHNGFRRHVYRFYKPNERRVLNDGMWHYVHVTYTIKDIKVRIDNLFFAPMEPDDELFVSQLDDSYNYNPYLLQSERDERLFLNDQIVVGGDTGQVNGFVGCMRALMVNGNLLDLYGHAKHEPGYLTFPGCIGQCDRNPCQNNGICFEYWDRFVCDCRESAFAGEICTEEIGYYYDGSDVTVWTIPSSLRQKSMATDTITFGFMTDKPQGTIFLLESDAGSGTSIHAFMSGDGLMVRFDYSGLYRELQDKNTYTDKKFHSVVIKRDTKITMQVDNYPTVVLDNVGSVPGLTNPSRFYVGNDATGKKAGGFIGCVSRLRVNHLVPLKAKEGLDRSGGGYSGNCGQLSPTIDPFWKPEFYPNWPNDSYVLPYGAIRDDRLHDINANVGIGVGIVGAIALIIIALVAIRFFNRKGSYRTQEDAGAMNTYDPNTFVTGTSRNRYPQITTRDEIFL